MEGSTAISVTTTASGGGAGQDAQTKHQKKQSVKGVRFDTARDHEPSSHIDGGSTVENGIQHRKLGHGSHSAASWKRKFVNPPEGGSSRRYNSSSSWVRRVESRLSELQAMFGLDDAEELVDTYMCALKKKILLQGRMYVFDRHVCFNCSLFGYHKLKSIPISSILSLRKMKNVGFPNSLEIVWQCEEEMIPKREFFTSFLSRDDAFKLIFSLWEEYKCVSPTETGSHDDDVSLTDDEHNAVVGVLNEEPPLELLHVHDGLIDLDHRDGSVMDTSGILTPRDSSPQARPSSPKDPFLTSLQESMAPAVPESMQKVMEYTLPVDPREFYDTFLSSKSDFFVNFHAAQGHKEIHLSEWDEHGSIGPVRDLSFITALKGFRIGPSEALCHQTQRVRVYKGSHIVFETSQVMSDIPYGDHFKVEARWDIFPDAPNTSALRIHFAVPFTKNTMWKKFIEKGVTESLLEAYQMFRKLADQKLASLGDLSPTDNDGHGQHRGRSVQRTLTHPEDLLPDSAEEWEMILGRVEPKFRGGLASLRKIQHTLADQNKFSLSKPRHRRNLSIIESDILDEMMHQDQGEESSGPTDQSSKKQANKRMIPRCESCGNRWSRIMPFFVVLMLVVVMFESWLLWRASSNTCSWTFETNGHQ